MQQDGGIWLIDDRSTFQITLTPALSRGTGRGGRKGSGPHRQRPDPRRAGRARHGERQWRIRWNGNELHDRCAVHGAKKCRAAARWRGRDKARRHEGTEAQRHGGTEARRVKAERTCWGRRKWKTEGSGWSMIVRRSKSPSPQPSPGVPGEGAGKAPVRNFLQFLRGALLSTVNGSASNSPWRKIELARGGQ
jgi:hypothetical protein